MEEETSFTENIVFYGETGNVSEKGVLKKKYYHGILPVHSISSEEIFKSQIAHFFL